MGPFMEPWMQAYMKLRTEAEFLFMDISDCNFKCLMSKPGDKKKLKQWREKIRKNHARLDAIHKEINELMAQNPK